MAIPCTACTFLNEVSNRMCEMCGNYLQEQKTIHPRRSSVSMAVDPYLVDSDEDIVEVEMDHDVKKPEAKRAKKAAKFSSTKKKDLVEEHVVPRWVLVLAKEHTDTEIAKMDSLIFNKELIKLTSMPVLEDMRLRVLGSTCLSSDVAGLVAQFVYSGHNRSMVEVQVNFALLEHFVKTGGDFPDRTNIFKLVSISNNQASLVSAGDVSAYKLPHLKRNVAMRPVPARLARIEIRPYQLKNVYWMKSLEDQIAAKKMWRLNGCHTKEWAGTESPILFDVATQRFYLDAEQVEQGPNSRLASVGGGVLADAPGMGKTISCLGLMLANPGPTSYPLRLVENRWPCKANLVVCPSQLCSQWENEIVKFTSPKLHVVVVTTKIQHQKVSYEQILNADVVIISTAFLDASYYAKLSTISESTSAKTAFGDLAVPPRDVQIETRLIDLSRRGDRALKETAPPFEHFRFRRVILDEGHEQLVAPSASARSATRYSKTEFLQNLRCEYRWYVSGTPFSSEGILRSALRFLKFKLDDKEIFLKASGGPDALDLPVLGLEVENFLREVVYCRNTKESVGRDDLPPLNHYIMFVTLSPVELCLYGCAKEGSKDRRQIASHPQGSTLLEMSSIHQQIRLSKLKVVLTKRMSVSEDRLKRKIASLESLIQRGEMTGKGKQALDGLKTSLKNRETALALLRSQQKKLKSTQGDFVYLPPSLYFSCDPSNTRVPSFPASPSSSSRPCSSSSSSSKKNFFAPSTPTSSLSCRNSSSSSSSSSSPSSFSSSPSFSSLKRSRSSLESTPYKRLAFSSSLSSDESSSEEDPRDVNVLFSSSSSSSSSCYDPPPLSPYFSSSSFSSSSSSSLPSSPLFLSSPPIKYPRVPVPLTAAAASSLRAPLKPLTGLNLGDKRLPKMMRRYCTKLGAAMYLVISLLEQSPANRLILFSCWGRNITRMEKALKRENIQFSTCQGNVFVRNHAVQAFRADPNNKKKKGATQEARVLLLSLESSASGTNLTEATHILMMDPVAEAKSREEAQAQMAQAIGRAHRIGQTKELNVVWVLAKDSVEETLFEKNIADIRQVRVEVPPVSQPTLKKKTVSGRNIEAVDSGTDSQPDENYEVEHDWDMPDDRYDEEPQSS